MTVADKAHRWIIDDRLHWPKHLQAGYARYRLRVAGDAADKAFWQEVLRILRVMKEEAHASAAGSP